MKKSFYQNYLSRSLIEREIYFKEDIQLNEVHKPLIAIQFESTPKIYLNEKKDTLWKRIKKKYLRKFMISN